MNPVIAVAKLIYGKYCNLCSSVSRSLDGVLFKHFGVVSHISVSLFMLFCICTQPFVSVSCTAMDTFCSC